MIANTLFQPTDRLSISLGARAVDRIDTAPAIPGYVQGDARIAYQLTEAVEVYVAGENIVQETHLESNDTNRGQRAQRNLYAGARLRL